MQRRWGFCWSLLKHWKQALMGPVMGIVLLLWQQVSGKPLSWGWFCCLVFAALSWQFWTELRKAKNVSVNYPVPFLRHERQSGAIAAGGPVEFSVATEGASIAFDVELTSDYVDGINGTKVGMLWEVAGGAVQTMTPIKTMCVKYENGRIVPFNSGTKSQIDKFFELKKDFPNELLVTMAFKDSSGRRCPVKKFLITSKRDLRGNFKIGCSPIES